MKKLIFAALVAVSLVGCAVGPVNSTVTKDDAGEQKVAAEFEVFM